MNINIIEPETARVGDFVRVIGGEQKGLRGEVDSTSDYFFGIREGHCLDSPRLMIEKYNVEIIPDGNMFSQADYVYVLQASIAAKAKAKAKADARFIVIRIY
jgi:hypothetical protein